VNALLAKQGADMDTASRNRWLGLKLLSARNLQAFLAAVPRTQAESYQTPIPNEPPQQAPAVQGTDGDFELRLYRDFPLSLLASVANDPALPEAYRTRLPTTIWVRANLAGDYALADAVPEEKLALPKAVVALLARHRAAKTPEQRQQIFARILLVAEVNPNVRGPLGQGYDWGCGGDNRYGSGLFSGWQFVPDPLAAIIPNFLLPYRAAIAKEQAQRLALPLRSDVIGPPLLQWARQNPDDPAVPESLHDLVAMTRMECSFSSKPSTLHTSRDAFALLHRRYPKSEWTKKTPYHF
jgi:hypothetical protein